jgi:pyruvate,water dikinase
VFKRMADLVVPLSSSDAADADLFGPKAANQAALGLAGLPIPDGFCLSADAYRLQLQTAGVDKAIAKLPSADLMESRHLTNEIRIGLFDSAIAPEILGPLLAARQELEDRTGVPLVVRSSALVEDREGSSFAGQFESFLGLDGEGEFVTAVRACWAALWSVRALRYMGSHEIDPSGTAMALLVQPLIEAISSGGGLSQTANGGMILSATWGLGEAIAQGEVVPDRYELNADAVIEHVDTGRKTHKIGCHLHEAEHHHTARVAKELVSERCLDDDQVIELAGHLKKAEAMIGMAAEIEWAQDEAGFKMLQVRPLQMETSEVPDEIWLNRPGLKGHPAGIGWGQGKACVINCECELARVGPGDILVTTVAGPTLSQILPMVSGVVAELGGSTSHLASLARERGIPMVLGVQDATTTIPDGSQVAVDGVAGFVRWIAE